MTIEEQLDQLANFYAARDVMMMQKAELIKSLIPEIPIEVQAKIAEVEAEFEDKSRAVIDNIVSLENSIKLEVAKNQQSAKGQFLQAVFVKGRTSWDSKALEGFMVAHPEIAAFKKTGEPSVNFRKI